MTRQETMHTRLYRQPRGKVVSTPVSHLGGPGSEYRSSDRLLRVMFFAVYISTPGASVGIRLYHIQTRCRKFAMWHVFLFS